MQELIIMHVVFIFFKIFVEFKPVWSAVSMRVVDGALILSTKFAVHCWIGMTRPCTAPLLPHVASDQATKPA